jgi:N-acetylmuramoyl-L-alanine amidase
MKKAFAILFVFLLILFPFPERSRADNSISLFLDGKRLNAEVTPRLVGKGTTMVPIRIIAEELGCKVTWNSIDQSVTIERDQLKLTMAIDKYEASVNGKRFELEAAPMLVKVDSQSSRTMIPVRFVTEQLGLKVTWDSLTRSVYLKRQQTATPAKLPEINVITASEGGISIRADGPITPNVFVLDAPDRIVIDVPNTTISNNLNGTTSGTIGELPSSHSSISKIRYSLFSEQPSTVRIVVDLFGKTEYTIMNTNNQEIKMAVKFLPKYKVMIDPGHGDFDPGAISVNGLHEKDFTLSLSSKIYQLLAKTPEIQPLMTRTDDRFISLEKRAEMANSQKADLFVSIHGNKYNTSSISGTETYYSRAISLPFAKVVHGQILNATGFVDRGVRKADFKVIRLPEMPAVLCEIGYLSNVNNETNLFDPASQDRIAEAIVLGIKSYFQIN